MASPQVSPGIQVNETAIDNTIPATTTGNGAFVGNFMWGPVGAVTELATENQLVARFGAPSDSNYVDFFSAANFLAYTDNLNLIRVVGAASLNAVSSLGVTDPYAGTTAGAILIKNQDDYNNNFSNNQVTTKGVFVAKYAGSLGNSVAWSMADAASYSKVLVGTITTTLASPNVVGVGTHFLTTTEVNSVIKSASGQTIGIVQQIVSDTEIILTTNALYALTAASGVLHFWQYANLFPAPGTSAYVANLRGSNDELHIVEIDAGGLITGTAGQIIKTYAFVSKAYDAKNSDGTSNFFGTVINRTSAWLWQLTTPTGNNDWSGYAANTAFTSTTGVLGARLVGGADANVTDGELMLGWEIFTSVEDYDISLAVTGGASYAVQQYVIQNVAEVRKDVVAFVSPQFNSVINNVGNEAFACVTDRNSLPSSSYVVMDNNWKYQYDKYNDVYRWIPVNADIAGLCAATQYYFVSPAGVTKGQIKNVKKLAWVAKKPDRDTLYQVGVNSVITTRGQGTYLFGDKTLQSKPGSFDRINVRRLFIGLEKSISIAAQYNLFEFNDSFTQARFVNTNTPFLRTVQGLRGITDFRVICDSTNNTPDIVGSNQFVGTILVKPNYSINFITLNFVSVGASVSFSSLGQ